MNHLFFLSGWLGGHSPAPVVCTALRCPGESGLWLSCYEATVHCTTCHATHSFTTGNISSCLSMMILSDREVGLTLKLTHGDTEENFCWKMRTNEGLIVRGWVCLGACTLQRWVWVSGRLLNEPSSTFLLFSCNFLPLFCSVPLLLFYFIFFLSAENFTEATGLGKDDREAQCVLQAHAPYLSFSVPTPSNGVVY